MQNAYAVYLMFVVCGSYWYRNTFLWAEEGPEPLQYSSAVRYRVAAVVSDLAMSSESYAK